MPLTGIVQNDQLERLVGGTFTQEDWHCWSAQCGIQPQASKIDQESDCKIERIKQLRHSIVRS